MMRPRRLATLTIPLLFGASACGGSDDEPTGTADGELVVRAVQAGPFEDVAPTVTAGEVTLRLVNEDELGHSLVVEQLDEGISVVAGGDEGATTVRFEAGTTYTLYCDVPGHRELGMEASVDAEG